MNYNIKRENELESSVSTENLPPSSNHILQNVLLSSIQEQRRARIWKTIWRLVWLICILAIASALFQNSTTSSTSPQITEEHTAIISFTGEITQSEYNDPIEKLRQGLINAYNNPAVKAIIIRANSPGGSPVLSNIAFEEIQHLRKQHPKTPLYVIIEDMCASGCYYIAAAADKIYADPSSLVGSIGVIGSSFDATELMEKLGIKRRIRIAGENKGMGDPFSEESENQKIIWQSMLNEIHQQFIQAVKIGRGKQLNTEQTDLFSGRIFTGIEAKKNGLIDDFGNIYNISRDIIAAPTLVDYTPKDHDIFNLLNQQLGMSIIKEIRSQITNNNRPW